MIKNISLKLKDIPLKIKDIFSMDNRNSEVVTFPVESSPSVIFTEKENKVQVLS